MDRQAKLLIVEDEDGLRRLVAQFLHGSGYQVIEAHDGPTAVEQFAVCGPFDLALVDLNLPGFSGVEVCRRMRQVEPSQRILICSAAVLPDYQHELREMRVDDYLTKPFHPDALLTRIAGLIGAESRHARPGRVAVSARI